MENRLIADTVAYLLKDPICEGEVRAAASQAYSFLQKGSVLDLSGSRSLGFLSQQD